MNVKQELIKIAKDLQAYGDIEILEYHFPSLSFDKLAEIVMDDWKNVSSGAKRSLGNMQFLSNNMGYREREVVTEFLANSSGWRGPTAKKVKTELKRRLK